MKHEEFVEVLLQHIQFPFEPEEVKEVDSNCGSVFIDLHDGRTYFIYIERCDE